MFEVKSSVALAKGFSDEAAFSKAVSDYIAAMEAHRFTTRGEATPTAAQLVELVVKRVQYPVKASYQPTHTFEMEHDGKTVTVTENIGEPVEFTSSEKPDDFVSNYVWVDDSPLPPTLAQRKDKLETDLRVQVSALTEKALPSRRRWLVEFTALEAMKAEAPTEDQKIAIATYGAYTARLNVLHKHVAEQLNEIENLTEETIDGWGLAPFPA